MVIRFKKLHKDAVAPQRAYPTDAGWDLTATSYKVDSDLGIITYFTGLAVAIPEGYVGLLFPRSSIYNLDLALANSVGVIDAGYRGEIMFKFRIAAKDTPQVYPNKTRVGQIVVIPIGDVFWDETDVLPESIRDTKGHGSSDLFRKLSS